MSQPDDEKLPDLSDALLGPAELAALFRDYRVCASGVLVQVKAGPGLVAPHAAPSLDEAEELIASRRIRGLQLRYEFGGTRWCDTLLSLDSGVRLVRIKA